MNILIGSDPELFVKCKGKVRSAHGLVKGNKQKPFPVDGGAIQVDGMALEFNTNPASTSTEFLGNVKKVMSALEDAIPEDMELYVSPVAHFGKDYINIQPKEAKELGCSPDFNAWTGKVNPTPNEDVPFRTAAGHIHIGSDTKLSPLQERQLVILCDLFVGLPSVFFDEDKERRSLYGCAGCYRSKPYGIEYRTLSNAWLVTDDLILDVFDASVKARKYLPDAINIFDFLSEKGLLFKVEEAINNSDKDVANSIMEALREGGYV